MGGYLNQTPTRYNLKLPRLLQQLHYDQVIVNWKLSDGNILDHIKADANTLLLNSCHSMAPHYPLRQLFLPTDVAQRLIDETTAPFDRHTVGLHFRGTDNVKCKARTTLDKFIGLIDAELEREPSATFFLATDEADVRHALSERYGRRLMHRQAVLSRNSVEGILDAAVDLYSLARTRRLIGSYWSSFSEIAAELGGIELEVCM